MRKRILRQVGCLQGMYVTLLVHEILKKKKEENCKRVRVDPVIGLATILPKHTRLQQIIQHIHRGSHVMPLCHFGKSSNPY